jgi:hypothetical protein
MGNNDPAVASSKTLAAQVQKFARNAAMAATNNHCKPILAVSR